MNIIYRRGLRVICISWLSAVISARPHRTPRLFPAFTRENLLLWWKVDSRFRFFISDWLVLCHSIFGLWPNCRIQGSPSLICEFNCLLEHSVTKFPTHDWQSTFFNFSFLSINSSQLIKIITMVIVTEWEWRIIDQWGNDRLWLRLRLTDSWFVTMWKCGSSHSAVHSLSVSLALGGLEFDTLTESLSEAVSEGFRWH